MSVRVVASPGVLDVFVEGADRFWGLRSRLEVPMPRVLGARVTSAAEAKDDLSIRTGGLGLPGVALVGHFRGRGAKRQWWRVYRGDRVVVIDLAPDSHFDRIVLQVDDPEAVVEQITAAKHAADEETER